MRLSSLYEKHKAFCVRFVMSVRKPNVEDIQTKGRQLKFEEKAASYDFLYFKT